MGAQHGSDTTHRLRPCPAARRARWDLLIVLAIFYSCGVLPLRAAFGDNTVGPFFMFDMALTVMFAVDILLNFNTGFDDDGIVVMEKVGLAGRGPLVPVGAAGERVGWDMSWRLGQQPQAGST